MGTTRAIREITGNMFPAARLFARLLLLLLASPAGASFEDLGAGARGPGMGDAMAAVADDVYAAHYNPAGLGTLTRPQFTAAYTQLFPDLTDGSKLGSSFFGYAHPLSDGRRGALAGALNLFSLNGGLYRENTLYLSYGRLAYSDRGGGELFLGGTAKYLSTSFGSFAEAANATDGIVSTGRPDPLLANGGSGRGAFDADLGALYRFLGHYQVGLQVAHLAAPDMASGAGGPDRLPLAVKLGLNYRSLISNLAVQAETRKAPDGSADTRLTAAAERWFPRTFVGDFGVRSALGLGSREYRQLNMGLSYRTRRLQVDYAYSLPMGGIEDTGGSHRMGITFFFGKPTEQEETLEMLMATLRGIKPAQAAAPQISTVTVYLKPELSPDALAAAEKLARSEEALRAGRYREAVALTSEVLKLAPDTAAAWQNMGIAYLGMEKYKSSLYAWEKALESEKSPALREAIRGYMKSIRRLARSTPRAKPAPAPAAPAAQEPQRPKLSKAEIDALLDQGVSDYVKGEPRKAAQSFEKVLEADPDNVEALKALRRLKSEEGI